MRTNKLLPSLVLAAVAGWAPAADLDVVRPACQSTVLTSRGRAPVILAPADGAGRPAAEQLQAALHKRLGVEPRLLGRIADAQPGQDTVIALGVR